MDELKQDIKQLIVTSLNLKDVRAEEIGDEDPLFQNPQGGEDQSLGLDSIDALELAVAIERRFAVTIPDEAVGKRVFASVSALAEYVAAQRNK